MILKEFQQRVVATVRAYLEQLHEWRERAVDILEHDPDYDWAERAWQQGGPGSAYTRRRNGLGVPLPTFCLKIPTGGGKTLLAIKIIDLVNVHYLRRQTGLVLWIVPSTQIYNQTLRALKDRDHPYRQQLDLSSAGRTTILEKVSAFSPEEVREHLCVLLLMLPSANRETKESLRLFRDSGGFERFFPSEDDVKEQHRLINDVPNLDTFESGEGLWGRQVKTSLGNTLRLLEPLIVLDEGHKAYSKRAKATLEGFNPCLVVELSATPPKSANVLVQVSGRDLLAEEMIKLDLHIRNNTSVDWKHTMLDAIEHRDRLELEAIEHEATTNTYIRPICLIQVERTGKGQRGGGFIHSEDVREYLLRHPGIRPEHIAIKTSQKDELKDIDEVGGLLSRDCPIRYIITKQALQEGWDCAFAYVLVILANPSSRSALTQLVGRILRQPFARKTNVPALDESYVFCFQRQGKVLLQEVRKGFGLEGLQGLEGRVALDQEGAVRSGQVVYQKRIQFRDAAQNLVLPAFMVRDSDGWRLVSYEADILARVPWDEVDITPLYDLALGKESRGGLELRTGLDTNLQLTRSHEGAGANSKLDCYFAANHLLDVMPNPWRGYELARQVFDALLEKHPRERVVGNYIFVLEEMRKHLEVERDHLSQRVFEELLDTGVMRFMVIADELAFTRPPPTIESRDGSKQANRDDGVPFMRSLFERTSEDEMNRLEASVATYLDRQEHLFFWYRNRPRKDYFVQGWKRGRIYADFIFTLKADEPNTHDAFHQVFVMETKGLHLKRTEDTDYKRAVFHLCSMHAQRNQLGGFCSRHAGQRHTLRGRRRGESGSTD